MYRKSVLIAVCLIVLGLRASAQTNVTNSNNGTTNTIPVYTGSATLGNSPISVSGSNVGIGTTTPTALFDVSGNIGSGANLTYFHMTDSNSVLHTLAIGANGVPGEFCTSGNHQRSWYERSLGWPEGRNIRRSRS